LSRDAGGDGGGGDLGGAAHVLDGGLGEGEGGLVTLVDAGGGGLP